MTEFAELILRSGRSGVELALFILLPVMIVMLTLMRLLEQYGLLDWIAHALSPLVRPLGIPGIGVFAMLQVHFVSFAAPLATLALMDRRQIAPRKIAATLAMVLAMAQANVIFPMAAVGLDVGLLLALSLFGGAVAAASTYYGFARGFSNAGAPEPVEEDLPEHEDKTVLSAIQHGGREALEICLGAIPLIVLALFAVNALQSAGAIAVIEQALSPLFDLFDVPVISVLPIVTKVIAGGTAMMGVMMDLLQRDLIDIVTVNRLAGFLINPLDILGLAIFMTAGRNVAAVIRPAVYGALLGVLLRGLAQFVIVG